jgi:putative tryptophan/tyrosine transport system substrate-binding protein
MTTQVRRRDFITLLGGAVAWPLAARAQQGERTRRIGALMNLAADDSESQVRVVAFAQGLSELGWTEGRNLRIDFRWAAGEVDRFRSHAAELVALAPDVILASASPGVTAVQQATRTLPVVFVTVVDPVGAGIVPNLARPGGNTTGFTLFEYAVSGKWLEQLKEIAPRVTRVAVLRDSASAAGIGQFAAIQSAASSFGVELVPLGGQDGAEIERGITAFARSANGALIVTAATSTRVHRELIIKLAARHRLPAVYSDRVFVAGGGLISYGPDRVDHFRRAAGYVDRILKGGKPGDLPVQAPTKYELVINLKTAKALGLTVPDTLLARADEVIE